MEDLSRGGWGSEGPWGCGQRQAPGGEEAEAQLKVGTGEGCDPVCSRHQQERLRERTHCLGALLAVTVWKVLELSSSTHLSLWGQRWAIFLPYPT